jgi:hypothetical protein
MMLILVPKVSNRVRYIMNLMLTRLLGIDFQLTTSVADFEACENEKFSYGVSTSVANLFFASNGLLFESKIAGRELKHFSYQGGLVFFPEANPDSALPYDIFSAAFYLVSRYEEYLPHLRDHHNRFQAIGSDAFKNDYLHKPLVNFWSLELKSVLEKWFPGLKFTLPTFKFTPSIDVDAAWSHKNKGLTRAFGGMLKAIQAGRYHEVKQRIRVLMRLEHDPFDTFELQLQLQKKYGYQTVYFILLADYGTNDKNIPYNNRHFQNLIRLLADYSEVGIHPSYASSNDPHLLTVEINRLSKILKKEVCCSRQHYLKLSLPETYRHLLNNDITHDYTMGYADVAGYRASICTPFPFFDLDNDMSTELIIHPFAVMDGTLMEYMGLTPEKAIAVIDQLMQEAKKCGGEFIPLWHNPTLNDTGEWEGWYKVYITMVESALKE